MATENKLLMAQARASLKGKWNKSAYTVLVYGGLVFVISLIPILGTIANILIAGPIMLGYAIYWLNTSRGNDTEMIDVYEKGFDRFGRALGAYILVMLFTILWSLLLIIPGIIAALSYSMTYFILAEDSNISANDAINKSKKMMYGYKWKFFCLNLRFLGWLLLSFLTIGIGLLWLIPYMQTSIAKFYEDIKENEKELPTVVEVPKAL